MRTLFASTLAAAALVDCGAKPETPLPPPRPGDLPRLDLIPETRMTLDWEETTQTLRRTVEGREFPDDDDLEKAIAAAHAAWVEKGKPDAAVTIDADPRAPWTEVVKVVNVIKRCGIDKIEFAMRAPPKEK